MKITESKLRKIIRRILKESNDISNGELRELSAEGILAAIDEKNMNFFDAVDMVLYDREDGYNGQFTEEDEEWIMNDLIRKWGERPGSISSYVRDYFDPKKNIYR